MEINKNCKIQVQFCIGNDNQILLTRESLALFIPIYKFAYVHIIQKMNIRVYKCKRDYPIGHVSQLYIFLISFIRTLKPTEK